MPVILMFMMLTSLTLALFATGFRISQVISRRSGGRGAGDDEDDGDISSEWRKSADSSVHRKAGHEEDAHPLLRQEQ
jgi:hypothetical protein